MKYTSLVEVIHEKSIVTLLIIGRDSIIQSDYLHIGKGSRKPKCYSNIVASIQPDTQYHTTRATSNRKNQLQIDTRVVRVTLETHLPNICSHTSVLLARRTRPKTCAYRFELT